MKILWVIQILTIISVGIWILNYAKSGTVDPFEFISNWRELQKKTEVYIRSVFRVSDQEFRVVMVKNVLAKNSILYSFDGNNWNLLNISCQREGECPRKFSFACVYTGYIGYIIDEHLKNPLELYFRTNGTKEIVRHKIIDVRPTHHQIKHKLGVCIQPLFFYTNWPFLIMFFEYWLQQKATVFYIYYESFTDDVKTIINYYKKSKNVKIKLIDWSKLPESASFNPNLYSYRLEPELAIYDCMHRMRRVAEFVAQTDIDEVIHLNSEESLVDFLVKLRKTHPDMASVNFRSQRVRIDNVWDSISGPDAFNFWPWKYSAKFESQIFPRSLYSKNVYIPSRVRSYDIHHRLQTESNRYRHYNASIADGVVLHFRQLSDIFPWKSVEYSLELKNLASKLDYNFMRRMAKRPIPILGSSFQEFGHNLTRKIENCRQKASMKRREVCPSLELCDPLTDLNRFKWEKAGSSWTTLN